MSKTDEEKDPASEQQKIVGRNAAEMSPRKWKLFDKG